MSDEKKRVAYWADSKSNLLLDPVIRLGDPVTDVLTEERKDYLAARGKVTFEPVEEEEKADLVKTRALEKSLSAAEERIKVLESGLEGIPKNITAARKQIKELKSSLVEKDIEIEALKKSGSSKGAAALQSKFEDLEAEIVKKEVEIENLGVQIEELTKTIEDLTKPEDE